MLYCSNIKLKLSNNIIINNISFSASNGNLIFIKGKNGSGKTSLLRIIGGIITNYNGIITYNNKNILYLNKPYAEYIGHLLPNKTNLTVYHYLEYLSTLYNKKELLEYVIKYLGFNKKLNKLYSRLSYGNKKKIIFARLIFSNAKLFLLDEIESNLDKTNINLLCNIIKTKLNKDNIVICSTHQKPFINPNQIIKLTNNIND